MTFEELINVAWSEHGKNPEEVLQNLISNLNLATNQDEVIQIGYLITHICGEHLGEWSKGVNFIQDLRNHSQLNDKSTLNRFIASLSLCEDKNFSLNDFSSSDKIRIWSMAASALASQNDLSRSAHYLKFAEEMADSTLPKEDPANRNLAIAGNNLASALLEKESLSLEEMNLMIHAGFVGRKFWEIAGTWKEVERAEYRLANVFLKADILDKAFTHAEKCLEIISKNGNEALELFFGLEALASVELARKNLRGYHEAIEGMQDVFSKLGKDERSWCKETLDRLQRQK